MPNIWTHFIFGRELADLVGFQAASASPELRRVYNIGCQGPDFLFYHRFLPWQKTAGMPELGSAMHSRQCGPFLLDLLEAVRGKPLNAPDTVFALGFLTHHILDRNAHPYVFYLSGFKKWDHQRFEIFIDTLVARTRLGIETWNTPVWKEIDAGGALPGGIAAVFERLTRLHYPELGRRFTARDWDDAYRDMIRAQKLFHDPAAIKRKITFGQIEPFLFKKEVPLLDFLNESRKEWRHPSILEERHTESFWDLWELAIQDGEPLMRAALDYIAPESAVAENGSAGSAVSDHAHARVKLEARLGDISYETGKPCSEGHKIVHANPML
ncbi:MAG: hypothetical protein K0Q94_510 [Paenibacillus sp.]|jgi:hypothetical protein|nr:hypothetical protein [Paenibacillus sp.]